MCKLHYHPRFHGHEFQVDPNFFIECCNLNTSVFRVMVIGIFLYYLPIEFPGHIMPPSLINIWGFVDNHKKQAIVIVAREVNFGAARRLPPCSGPNA